MTASKSTSLVLTTPSDREILGTRVFDAPRELVFKAFTDPDVVAQWWGPRKYTTTVDKMDVTPGGAWRFVQRGPDGGDYAFNGVYREVVPPERLVYTFEFEAMPGHISVETITLEKIEGGKTRMTDLLLFDSIEDRDGMLQSGMEAGWAESMDRFSELLQKLDA